MNFTSFFQRQTHLSNFQHFIFFSLSECSTIKDIKKSKVIFQMTESRLQKVPKMLIFGCNCSLLESRLTANQPYGCYFRLLISSFYFPRLLPVGRGNDYCQQKRQCLLPVGRGDEVLPAEKAMLIASWERQCNIARAGVAMVARGGELCCTITNKQTVTAATLFW